LNKRLIFVLSPGRCGTRYLSEVVATIPGMAAVHERPPDFADASRLAQFIPEAATRFWFDHKLPAIERYPELTYFETSHTFIAFAGVALQMDNPPDLVVLTRPHREVALSRWRRGSVPGRTPRGNQYCLHPNAPGVILKVNNWRQFTDYQLCYWFCLEVEARSEHYAHLYARAGADVYRTSLAEIVTEQGFLKLVRSLHLKRPSIIEYRKRAGKKVNAHPDWMNKRFPDGDLNEMEVGVKEAIDSFSGRPVRTKPSVHIFLINTGSVREELSAWRERWKADGRYDVRIEGGRGFPVTDNRGRCVLEFLSGGRDYMGMVDEDVVPQRNILDLIEHDLDVVCFPTPIWRPTKSPLLPMVLNTTLIDDNGQTINRTIQLGEAEDLHPISSGGTGCIMIAPEFLNILKCGTLFRTFGALMARAMLAMIYSLSDGR